MTAIKKSDLQLATFYQLAGLIEEWWDGADEKITQTCKLMSKYTDFEGSLDPDLQIKAIVDLFLQLTDHYPCPNTETLLIKQELQKRLKEHETTTERAANERANPILGPCEILV